MDCNKTEFVDKTILNTPKPTACSTVDRKSFHKKKRLNDEEFENSLALVNESAVQERICDKSLANMSYKLEQERLLANSSLQRANKVAGLPSKYLKPNLSDSSVSNENVANSTFNESDLLKSHDTPKNTSTPKTSVASNDSNENNLSRLSLGQSMAQLSYQIGNTDISIDNFVLEFQKAMNTVDKESAHIESKLFSPAEEAASMLLADEMSWRRKNEMPVENNISKISTEDMYSKISMGEFFQQKSDTLSDIRMALSPVKSKKPVALIDSSVSFTEQEENKKKNSLSISAIQKLLAETDDTPRKVTSYLLKQGHKVNETSVDQLSLPVSKNSSYTSNYSDNEAMRKLVCDKENIDNFSIPQKEQTMRKENIISSSDSQSRPLSTSSRNLSSALTSLPNGKLPIESTKAELIWGCVKVDKCVTQDFLLRNKTSKRLCLQMSVSGHDFKIRKDNRQESEPLSTAKILLHPHESRSIIVSFIPTKMGAAIDELKFTSLDPNLQQTKKQSVRLFGYGGFGKLEFLNLTKDVAGRFWLNLGKLDNFCTITHSFVLKSTGTLPSFAYITFNPKELFAFASISLTPSSLVLYPNEQKEIVVTLNVTMEDYQILQKSFSKSMIAEIGSLLVISGTEVNRGRLRRQCRKCLEKNLEIDPTSNLLKEKIKGENMPSDLSLFKESPGNSKEILKLFTCNEVVVTIEQDPEVTLMPQYPDESGMFQSLYQDATAICLETTTVQASCKLEPSSIILIPPTKMKDSLFLISECNRMLHFEATCIPEGLELSPKEGVIAAGQQILISITCPKLNMKDRIMFKVSVCIENEVLEATVKIVHLQA